MILSGVRFSMDSLGDFSYVAAWDIRDTIAATGRHNMKRFVPFLMVLLVCIDDPCLHAQDVVINEFMFAPVSGSAEWIELYNPGDSPANVRGWTLSDRSRKTTRLADEDTFVPAHGFLVIASAVPLGMQWEQIPVAVLLPPSFPSLNNSGDDIVLRDAEDRLVDSLTYTASWSPTRGVSAERIRADAPPLRENWAPSMASAGGTPGEENSAAVLHAEPRSRDDLLFNELMPAPLPSSCEWVEVLNNTADDIPLGRWTLLGKPNAEGKRPGISLPADAGVVPAHGYAVIAADSSVLTTHPALGASDDVLLLILNRSSLDLGNSEDELLFVDATGNVIDSMWYHESWHSPLLPSSTGISLELIHPAYRTLGDEAWNSCSDPSGGTPGKRNSVYSEAPPGQTGSASAISVIPNPFSPDGDGFEDACLLRCELPAQVNQVRLRVYDAEGRCIATLRNNNPMGRETLVVWDGTDDAGRRARIGCYVVLLEGLDPRMNTVTAAKTVIVVARKL